MTPMLGLEKTLMNNGGTTMSLPLWTPSQISTALWLDANDTSTITINEFTGQNLFTDPEGFDTAQWTKTNCTIIPDTASPAPDGSYSSEKIVSVIGTSTMRVHQVVTTTSSTVYTVSAYFKAVEAAWISFRISEDTAPSCWFDVANGVVGTREAGWSASSITNVGNGWFRCQATFTTIGTSYTFRFTLANANNATDYTGNGVNGVLIWGAQLNTGSTALRYKSPQVAQWSDKSGNGRHATQVTALNQPLYDAAGLNGKPVLTFDGINSTMQAGDTTTWRFLHNGSKYTIIGVWRPGTATTPGTQFMTALTTSNNSGSGNVGQYFAFGDSFGFRYNVTSGGSGGAFVSISRAYTGVVGSFGNATIVALQVDPANATAGNRVFASVNGGSLIGGNSQTGSVTTANSNTPLAIGGGTATFRYLGGMSEILIVDGDATSDLSRLQGYLAWKWGLVANLPSGHPYKNSPPIV